jgi:tetratricopeptide (TPR) repeat protein
MSDVSVESKPLPERRGGSLNLWLNIALAVLILAALAGIVYFGYSVYRDRQSDLATSAAGRLAGLLRAQVRQNPNDAVLRVRLGEALGGMGKYSEATGQFNAALKIDPKHLGAYLDLGIVALAAKNPDAAEGYFKKVIDLTDASEYRAVSTPREVALYNLGKIALDKKSYGDAAGFFKAALFIRKDASDTYYYLAKSLQGMGEIDGAIQQLDLGLAFDPGYAEAHYLLGQLYKEKKDDVNASYHFAQAAELAPDADPPREAVEAFGPVAGWIDKARKALAAGDREAALTAILVARNLDAKSFEAAKLHGEVLVSRGNLKDALDVYRQASALDSTNAEVKAQIAGLEPQVAALLKAEAAKKAAAKKKSK